MSFAFDWPAFAENEVFLEKCKSLLNVALNKATPSIIQGPIKVAELSWGDEAPTLETLEIGEVANDRFRGIFKLNYGGNGRLTLATKVQANLLNVYSQTAPSFTRPEFVGSSNSLSIPLNLTLSDIKMSGIVICVFSRAKGLTCVFRNDPLQSIKVSSTFDGIPGIATFLQSQIENLIGGLFREELPAILYSHSQIWTRAGQDELLAQAQRLNGHDNFLKQHMELQKQLKLDHADADVSDDDAPVRFSEIYADKQVSFVSTLRIETMLMARRTLALSTPSVSTTILRSELSRRHAIAAAAVPVTMAGSQIHEHVHAQAQRLAVKHNHKPRRRVLNLKKKRTSEDVPPAAAAPNVDRPEVQRRNSTPALSARTEPATTPTSVSAISQIAVSPVVTTIASTDNVPLTVPVRVSTPPASVSAAPPPLHTETKAEIERIKSLLYPPKPSIMRTSFFVPNAKLPYAEEAESHHPGHEAPPAYVA